MSGVTSNSTTPTQCSPPTKKARMEQDTSAAADVFKPVGSLAFRIDNFREFTNSPPGEASKRHCDAKVSLRGLTFGMAVYPRGYFRKTGPPLDCMGILLRCENTSGCDVKGDGSWSCLASVTLQIKSLLKSGEDTGPYKYTHKFFSTKEKSSLEWHDEYPWKLDYLLNQNYGLYNKKEDTLELIAQISVDTPFGILELPKSDAIHVNEERVFVNKNQLAMNSRYFHHMFYNAQFREGQSGEYKVKIGAPATVEHFKRMMQTLYPENRPLDDKCIEGVLYLANQFLMTDVEGKCLQFLMEKSKKSALFKYRVADKYGFAALKDHVLDNLEESDFEKKLYKVNLAEYVKLGPSAAEAYLARYDELFPPESDEEDE